MTIVGNGNEIDAGGYNAFDIDGSATVTDLTVVGANIAAFGLDLLVGDTGSFTNVNTVGGTAGINANLDDGASLTVTGGSYSEASDGIYIYDDFGTATVAISGATFTDHTDSAIDVANYSGDSTVTINDVTITDAYYGIYFYGYNDAAMTVTDAVITAGDDNNPSGNGYGLYAYLEDAASATFDGGSITGDPDGARFYYGVETYQYDESSVVVSNSSISGNDYNVYVDLYDDFTYFALLISAVTNGNYDGVYLSSVAGYAYIDETTIDGNGRDGDYPGLYAYVYEQEEFPGAVRLSRSTISNTNGMGIDVELDAPDTYFTVVDSTVSGNGSGDSDSVIEVDGNSEEFQQYFVLLNSTVTDNEGNDSIVEIDDVEAFISHTIVSGNTVEPDGVAEVEIQDDAVLELEWSVVGSVDDSQGTFIEGAGVKYTTNPGVGPLAANGGPTMTHLLLASSPALNAGNPTIVDPPLTDQRGDVRIIGVIDIGSVEMPAVLAATGSTAPAGAIVAAGLLLLLGGAFMVVRRRTA